MLPNFLFTLRDIFHARVVGEVGLRGEKTEMDERGEGRNLPRVVSEERGDEGIRFLRRLRVEKLAKPGALADFRLLRSFVGRKRSGLRGAQFGFL